METKGIQHIMNSYSAKMILLSGMAILLLIPSLLIQDIIRERMDLSEKVRDELYTHWGARQVIAGPVLNVPFSVNGPESSAREPGERMRVAHFLPETLKAEGILYPETRKRGIYKVVVYRGKIILKGSFAQPDVSQLDIRNACYNWDAAYFTLGIPDMRGIRNMPELAVSGMKLKAEPGVADTDLFRSGITIKAGSLDLKHPVNFETDLVLNGSDGLSVEALGKTSEIQMKSGWSQPGFTGGFLPVNRRVTASGFSVTWQVTHLNRNFPQQWVDRKYKTHDAGLGVDLLIPVDHYQKSMRSVKYAILFIGLNFIIFLFIETKSKARIHLFQYPLVAFALLIFYVLLISIGEQIGFNLAYLVSAMAVILQISWFAWIILRNTRMVARVTFLQTGLYLFLFIILQMQDYALLAGSIGLFIILGFIMHASQQIRWNAE